MPEDSNDRSTPSVARERHTLEAALELFRERGFDGVTVDQIGERAGLHGPGIYRTFGNKNEILATLFDEAMDRLQQFVGPVREDPREELDVLVFGQVAFALGDARLLSVYAREDRSLSGDARRRLNRRQRQHVDRWVAALGRIYPQRDEADLVVTTHAVLGQLLSVAHWPEDARSHPSLDERLRSLARASLMALEQ